MSLPRITDFEILEKLGAGSYATVYKARHKVGHQLHTHCISTSATMVISLIFTF